ncbi:hypothetical protein BRADI_5g22275v3 [Brachypodium distachyon]|uniref:Uncharacterized protein n=1 Tax=Brachypodium distachyon TaxID=15368 RepID=A0A0Q3P6U6_BRADI|nr:hypothetical protein BRADI_5g22275v3 [Brachypodium distachyon]
MTQNEEQILKWKYHKRLVFVQALTQAYVEQKCQCCSIFHSSIPQRIMGKRFIVWLTHWSKALFEQTDSCNKSPIFFLTSSSQFKDGF